MDGGDLGVHVHADPCGDGAGWLDTLAGRRGGVQAARVVVGGQRVAEGQVELTVPLERAVHRLVLGLYLVVWIVRV